MQMIDRPDQWVVYAKSDTLWLHELARFETFKEAEAFRNTLTFPAVIVWR